MYQLRERLVLADELAEAFLAAPWREDSLAEAGSSRLDRWPEWMFGLAFSTVAVFRDPPAQSRALALHIEQFLASIRARGNAQGPPEILRSLPAQGFRRRLLLPQLEHSWPLASIGSPAELAEILELDLGQLTWLADVKSLERLVRDEKLRNYRYAAVPRRSGVPRLIEAPKARLKEVQRWVLREILGHVPVHDAAHGFTAGRSVATNAAPHLGQRAVLRLDLKDFFASVSAGRVFGVFATIGYAPPVAHILTGLCTNVVPTKVWAVVPVPSEPRRVQERFWLGRQLATPHLPQGAPTSPALANLAAFRFDRRLAGLARSFDLRYTRYADDLTFSGSDRLRRQRPEIEGLVDEIAREEGFVLNAGKSRLHTAASRQSVCGVVVNVRPNVERTEYDQLKAILHNAARFGPASQNRDGVPDFAAHISGRIAWVASLNPERGEKLRRRFAEVAW